MGVAVVSKGELVATAVATTRVGCEIDDVEVEVAVDIWNAPIEETVILGAVSLLQQLARSLFARQQ
jgi:hypothetical protein